MAIRTAKIGIDNIDDSEGLESIKTALQNIDGVTNIGLHPQDGFALVKYDDTQTSFHAFKAAVSTVDYVTQAFPEDAPQNPDT